MNQIDPSKATFQTDPELSPARESGQKTHGLTVRFGKLMKVIGVIISAAFLILLYVLANKSNKSHGADAKILLSSTDRALEVEVLDGAGSMKAAQHVTNVLRLQGYDVVEMKRNTSGIVEQSFILDRSGNLDAARKLAEDIGISQEKVFQKIDRNLYLDITVMVGRDFPRLKVFQFSTERRKY
jgi:hypothetical protein